MLVLLLAGRMPREVGSSLLPMDDPGQLHQPRAEQGGSQVPPCREVPLARPAPGVPRPRARRCRGLAEQLPSAQEQQRELPPAALPSGAAPAPSPPAPFLPPHAWPGAAAGSCRELPARGAVPAACCPPGPAVLGAGSGAEHGPVPVSPGWQVPPPPPRVPGAVSRPLSPEEVPQPPGGWPLARTNMEMLFQAL